MGEGCEGRNSGNNGNNKVWAIRKKLVLMKIRRYGQYVKSGNDADNKVWAIHI